MSKTGVVVSSNSGTSSSANLITITDRQHGHTPNLIMSQLSDTHPASSVSNLSSTLFSAESATPKFADSAGLSWTSLVRNSVRFARETLF